VDASSTWENLHDEIPEHLNPFGDGVICTGDRDGKTVLQAIHDTEGVDGANDADFFIGPGSRLFHLGRGNLPIETGYILADS